MNAAQALSYIEKSGEALGAAAELAEKVAAEDAKVASQLPTVVAALIDRSLIHASEEKQASDTLSTASGCLGVITNLVNELGQQKQAFERKLAAAGNGQPVPSATKQASAPEDNYVGRRRGAGELSAADKAMLQALNLSR